MNIVEWHNEVIKPDDIIRCKTSKFRYKAVVCVAPGNNYYILFIETGCNLPYGVGFMKPCGATFAEYFGELAVHLFEKEN